MLKKLAGLLTNNFGLKILAVLFSIALWLIVVNIDDPKLTKPFTTTVTVENEDYIAGLGKYYEVTGNTNTVTFYVTGKRSYLEKLSGSDFKAIADMESIEDLKRVPIEITPQRYSTYVTVSGKTKYLEISVEELMEKPCVITVKTEGKVLKGRALGEVTASPSILRISGPQSLVSTIDKAVATINVDGMSENMTDSVIPVLYDVEGDEVETTKLTFNVQSVMIQAPILDTKEVKLNFQTTGTPPDGYDYVETQYTPEKVKVKGDSTVLNTINSITIPEEVLDLSEAVDDIEKTVDISSYLPDGVSLVDNSKSKIDVVVKIEKHETKTFDVPTANITASNLPEGYAVEFATETVKVKIGGLTTDLEKLDAASLTGTIDVSGMSLGEHTLSLTLNLDSKYTLEESATVMIDIKKSGKS